LSTEPIFAEPLRKLFSVQSGTSTLLSRFSEVAVAVLLLLAAAVAAWG